MEYRCVNDPISLYCSDNDRWTKEHERIKLEHPDIIAISSKHLKCELNKNTCGFSYKFNAVIDPRLGKGVKEALIPDIPQRKETEKPVAKKKSKQETQQGSLF